jgi:hypothetical protein
MDETLREVIARPVALDPGSGTKVTFADRHSGWRFALGFPTLRGATPGGVLDTTAKRILLPYL